MDWPTIRAAIRTAIISATGLRAQDVFWDGSPEATGWHGPSDTGWGATSALPPCTAELKIRQVRTHGTDEYRSTYVAAPSPARTTSGAGSRRILLQVRLESAQQSDGFDCFAVESLLRARLRRASVIAALQAAGIGQGRLGDSINADYVDEDRQMSVCIVEIPLWVAENDIDTTSGASDWIDTARAATEVDASPLAVQADTGQVPE